MERIKFALKDLTDLTELTAVHTQIPYVSPKRETCQISQVCQVSLIKVRLTDKNE